MVVRSLMLSGSLILANVSAGVLTPSSGVLDLGIPDGDPSGVVSTISVSGESDPIADLKVTLNLTASGKAAFNGDFFAYLTHDTIDGIAVLLNRPGKNAEDDNGTDGAGFSNVVFDDAADRGDVHVYAATLEATPGVGFTAGDPLVGTWAPDGRPIDPAVVVQADSRTALLASFEGQVPNGVWTLFVADVASGGMLTLNQWSLEIEVAPVPEPGSYIAFVVTAFVVVGHRRYRR